MARQADTRCSGDCGRLLWRGTGSLDNPTCRDCRGRPSSSSPRAKSCGWCGAIFVPVVTRKGPQYCSRDECRLSYRVPHRSSPWRPDLTPGQNRALTSATARRRARARAQSDAAAMIRHLSVDVRIRIHERDRWKCVLCGIPVSRTLEHPHPMSASIDHLVPLSEGGSQEPANLATAHLACNVYKGSGAMGEQLAIIG